MKPKLIQLLLLGLFAGASWADEGAPETDRTWEYNGYYNPVAQSHTFMARIVDGESSLELRCSARVPNAQLTLRLPPPHNQIPEIAVSFDTRKPLSMVWLPSVNGQSMRLSTEFIREFSRGLRAYNTLTVKVPGAESAEQSFDLSLRGSAKAITSLREHCRFI